jgi:hypothetical protein
MTVGGVGGDPVGAAVSRAGRGVVGVARLSSTGWWAAVAIISLQFVAEVRGIVHRKEKCKAFIV